MEPYFTVNETQFIAAVAALGSAFADILSDMHPPARAALQSALTRHLERFRLNDERAAEILLGAVLQAVSKP